MSAIGAKLLKGSTVRLLSLGLTIGIAFFMMPFLVKNLGEKTYGLWTLVGTILGYYGLIDFGLSSAIGRFLSRAIGRNDKDELRRVSATAFYVYGIIALIVLGLVILALPFLGFFLKDNSFLPTFRFLFIILGINFAIDIPVRAFNAVFSAHIRDDVNMGISIVKSIIVTILIVYAIKSGFGIVGMAWAVFLCSFVDNAFRIYFSYKIEPHLSISKKYYAPSLFKTLFSYSAFTFIGRVANILRFKLDQVVISIFLGLSAVTHYFVAIRLIEYFSDFVFQTITTLTPAFSQDEGRGDLNAVKKKFLFSLKISTYLSLFLGGAIFIIGPDFILRWMGDSFTDSGLILKILLISFIINLAQKPIVPLLFGLSKHKGLAYANMAEGILNLGISLALVKPFGILGVALGTCIPMTIMSIFAHPYFAIKAIDLSLSEYLKTLFKAVGIGIVLFSINWALSAPIPLTGYVLMATSFFLQAGVFLLGVFLFGFKKEEKEKLLSSIATAFPKLSFLSRKAT